MIKQSKGVNKILAKISQFYEDKSGTIDLNNKAKEFEKQNP